MQRPSPDVTIVIDYDSPPSVASVERRNALKKIMDRHTDAVLPSLSASIIDHLYGVTNDRSEEVIPKIPTE